MIIAIRPHHSALSSQLTSTFTALPLVSPPARLLLRGCHPSARTAAVGWARSLPIGSKQQCYMMVLVQLH
jgi:hypothetical protein